ncbi:hypothetical protein BH20ACT5_BH20ACT5_18280 [soil metagenome]
MHNAAMPTAITIRNVPDDARDELAARAKRSGRSLQAYLRAELIRLASVPSVDDWLAAVKAERAVSDTRLSTADILAAIDADRR